MSKNSSSSSEDSVWMALPPFTTCRVCRNRLSDLCFRECAPARDYRWFEMQAGVGFLDLPRFPLREFLNEMHPHVRQVVAAVYLAKISDFLQGIPKD